MTDKKLPRPIRLRKAERWRQRSATSLHCAACFAELARAARPDALRDVLFLCGCGTPNELPEGP